MNNVGVAFHGINLLLLLIPFTLFFIGYKIKRLRFLFFIIGAVTLIAMPFKLTNKPDRVRFTQDAVTTERHSKILPKVLIEKDAYDKRMAKKDAEFQQHAQEKLNNILGD